MTEDEADPQLPKADLEIAELALKWTREAGELTQQYFTSGDLRVEEKGDGTPVTRADREAEALLRTRISEAFPQDSILGEEHDEHVGSSGRSWVIDPIDGTKAFSHGVATYSNLLHFSDQNGPAVGIINLPALGECIWAARGRGAFSGDEPVSLPAGPAGDLDSRVLCVSGFHGWNAEMFERVHAAGVLVRTWGDAYGYALVATGRADAMYDPALEWWDLAAVALVVQEAGGSISRADGSPDVARPLGDGPYAYSAIASAAGSHDRWISLLSTR